MAECPHCNEDVATTNGKFVHHGDCPGGFALIEQADSHSEGRYTAPSEHCPHPERWHSLDWDSAEEEVTGLVGAFVRALRPDLVIETGSAYGQTAYAIGVALAEAEHGILHTIEPVVERANHTRARCDGLPVVVEMMESLDFKPPGPVGFAWFDSLLMLRTAEFRHFYEYLEPGAIVGFHDTAPHFGPGLWQGIEELETEGMLLPMRLRTPRGVVFGEVIQK